MDEIKFDYPAKTDKEVLPEVVEAVKSSHWAGNKECPNFDIWYAFRDFKNVPAGTYNPFRAALLKKI